MRWPRIMTGATLDPTTYDSALPAMRQKRTGDSGMHIYGLTGGVGSGKSEVARRLSARGIPVIDADRIGHALLESGSEVADAVVRAFGQRVLSCGRIDRDKLARVVFADPEALKKLNAITHPVITRVVAERCASLVQEGHDAAVIEAAIMAENGKLEGWLDGLILVTCAEETRGERLVRLRGMAGDEARRRIEAQSAPEAKIPLATWVIDNEGTLDQLYARTDEIAEDMTKHGD